MTDPIVPLASSLHAQPGCYALLLGSGVSRSSGIMTGWGIALDLVRRLAVLEDEPPPEDPLAWYTDRHGDDVDYSKVLEVLAPRPADRRALLDPYFEPTEDEREAGLKQPTAAHRAIAELVGGGILRIIVTLNFDRLIERALEEAGVEPLVISSADDARNAPPLHSVPCAVIKVHGDRMSPNLKNTLAELETYEPELHGLLAQVFREYGVIVCGWSADWDPALRRLVLENQPTIFSTFWAHRGGPTSAAQEIIKGRAAIAVPIEDADSFFDAVASKARALADLAESRPSSSDIAVAEVKRYVADPRHRVRLHDLLMNEVEQLVAATTTDRMPVDGDLDVERWLKRVHDLEEEASKLLSMLSTLAFHAEEDRHDELAVRAVERLATRAVAHGGKTALLNLQRYPALLALYTVGLAALAARRPAPVGRAFAKLERGERSESDVSLAYKLVPTRILASDALRATPDLVRRHTPCSDYLHSTLRPHLEPLVRDSEVYDELFDDLEYLHGLACVHATGGRWAPGGRFRWRRTAFGSGRGRRDRIVDHYGEELVASGMFDSSMERLAETHQKYEEILDSLSPLP